jgi:type II secretory pathway pseudopilin PulG
MIFRRRSADGEAGFTTVELMVALSVMAIGFFALAGALGFGLRQVTLSRQRQTATEIGNARIEHLRNVPYEAVALTTQPVHVDDTDNPDYFVSGDNTQFDVTGDGDYEDLIVDDTGGQVLHLEDPLQVGTVTMEVWQFATWYDQANNVKRLTVMVVYKPQVLGPSRMVRASTFFTPGSVTIEGTEGGANQGSGVPTSAPTTVPTTCASDSTGPTGGFQILSTSGQQGYTPSASVSLSMSLSDTCQPISMQFSNDGVLYSDPIIYDSSNPSVSWSLLSGDGTKSVYAKATDANGNVQTFSAQTVVLDTVSPTVPGTLSRSLNCSGTDRTVTLSWGGSTDAYFNGYRIYVSTNSGDWAVLSTTSLLTETTTNLKTLDSVRYYVVGYDKAGNESDATNIVSLSKNQCS